MTPACSTAHIRPVRPMPVATSSTTISAPNSSHRARHAAQEGHVVGEHPAGRLHHRLDHHRADLRRPRARAAARSSASTAAARSARGLPGAEHARRGDHPGLEQDRPVRRVEEVDAADADRAEGVAVVALGDVHVVAAAVRPRWACAWNAILIAASTADDAVAGVEDPGQARPARSPSSCSASSMPGSWVRPRNVVWSSRSSWARIGVVDLGHAGARAP